VVTHARQVLDPAAAYQHDRVLLQIMPFATNVAGHFVAIGQAHTRDLAQGRVLLFRGGGVNAGADATALRAALQGGHRVFDGLAFAPLANQLINGSHRYTFLSCSADVLERSRAVKSASPLEKD